MGEEVHRNKEVGLFFFAGVSTEGKKRGGEKETPRDKMV